MSRWSGVVVSLPSTGSDEMASRLSTHLHPVAGRPLIWHTVNALFQTDPPPERVVVVGDLDLPDGLFTDAPGEVREVRAVTADSPMGQAAEKEIGDLVLLDPRVFVPPASLVELTGAPSGSWLAGADGGVAAIRLGAAEAERFVGSGGDRRAVAAAGEPIRAESGLLVRRRADLATVAARIRDRLVEQLMAGGATFLLPESVLVDVDVRIGRDTVVYPGVILEGQTTIGDETVLGPGCRIISSWVGSGVEMKGWNYVAHTSIRNRAILEPYVRRGFD